MKKYSLLILLALFCFSGSMLAQERKDIPEDASEHPYWIEWMKDQSVNFYDVQSAFELYWQDRKITKGCGWKPFKRWEFMMQDRITSDGTRLPADYFLKEMEQYNATHPTSLKSDPSWSNLGPFGLPNDKGYEGLGRISSVAFHPSDPEVIFVGTPAGGLWITEDGGENWVTHTDDLPTLGVSAIAVDYNDPQVIYMGTGDYDHGDSEGLGMMKSFDSGETWNPINQGMNYTTVGRLIMDPTDPNILLAATTNGIYKTTDGGNLWEQTLSGSTKDIAFHPVNSSIIYAAQGADFMRSSDGGESWTQITDGLDGGSTAAIAVSAASPNMVYFLICGSTEFNAVYRSVDEGLSFEMRSNSPNIMSWGCTGGSGGQAWYDLDVAADPSDSDVIFAGGVNCFKSTDGGTSWEISSHWTGDCGVEAVHADLHVLEYNTLNDRLYAGNDGGLYYTGDVGDSWPEISEGMAISQTYKIGQSATDLGVIINGYQDNGTSTLLNGTFKFTRGGDGMECAVDYTDASYTYATVYYGSIVRYTNNGSSMTVAEDGAYGINEEGAWVTPFTLHKKDPNRMFVGYKNIWRGDNIKGSSSQISWDRISYDLAGQNGKNISVVEHSAINENIFYFARSDKHVFRSTNVMDDVVEWVDLTSKLPVSGKSCDAIATDTFDESVIYISMDKQIYKSVDYGDNWENISGTLPAVNFTSIATYKREQGSLYLASDVGVFYKNATMSDWLIYSSGLPVDASIKEIEIYYDEASPEFDMIRAGTFGRGLWESRPYYEQPTADFTSDLTEVPVGCEVQFSDLSVGVPFEWEWTFEAGTPATTTEQNPTVTYAAEGVYSVSLKVTNTLGEDTKLVSDYITILENVSPEVHFLASDTITCVGVPIYLTDETIYCPTGWFWEFDPSTVDFLDGTDANSQNPVIALSESGSYTVSLTSENGNGSTTLTKPDYLMAGGLPMPFYEDFEAADLESKGWLVVNEDGDITWSISEVGGNSPGDHAAWINYFDYLELYPVDQMISPILSFEGVTQLQLQFQHAYAQRITLVDTLNIKLSEDCGTTWQTIFTAFPDGNGGFATHENTEEFFIPEVADDWCGNGWGTNCFSLDISSWIGSKSVMVMFEGVGHFGNNLFIDNIMIHDPVGVAKVAAQAGFDLYPNPGSGEFTFSFPKVTQSARLVISNMSGQTVWHEILPQTAVPFSTIVDLSELPKGIYVVTLQQGDKTFTKKMVIQ